MIGGGVIEKKQELNALQIIRKRRSSLAVRSGYVSLIIRVILIAIIGWLFLTQVLLITQTKGNDMFPAMKDGDLVVAYRLQKEYVKNDVVVFTVNGKQRVGRILGRETDVIMMDDTGTLLVNGTAQTGEILYPTYAKEGFDYPYTVPEGCVYILNDYRTSGDDSRDFGAIPMKDVKGKVITILRRRNL